MLYAAGAAASRAGARRASVIVGARLSTTGRLVQHQRRPRPASRRCSPPGDAAVRGRQVPRAPPYPASTWACAARARARARTNPRPSPAGGARTSSPGACSCNAAQPEGRRASSLAFLPQFVDPGAPPRRRSSRSDADARGVGLASPSRPRWSLAAVAPAPARPPPRRRGRWSRWASGCVYLARAPTRRRSPAQRGSARARRASFRAASLTRVVPGDDPAGAELAGGVEPDGERWARCYLPIVASAARRKRGSATRHTPVVDPPETASRSPSSARALAAESRSGPPLVDGRSQRRPARAAVPALTSHRSADRQTASRDVAAGTPLPRKLGHQAGPPRRAARGTRRLRSSASRSRRRIRAPRRRQGGRDRQPSTRAARSSSGGCRALRAQMEPAAGLVDRLAQARLEGADRHDRGRVREIALPTGLVDNKVCAIDQTWSGLRLVIRLEHR